MTASDSNAHLLRDMMVPPDTTLMDAIAVLTRAAHKIILVTDPDRRLLGVVTDYDIRTAILNHVGFDQPIRDVMMTRPTVGRAGMSRADVLDIIRDRRCSQIPLLDEAGRVVDIHFMDEYLDDMVRRERVAVVMAGGLGKRLRPLTEDVPKPLLPVAGRPILFILLDQLLSEGFTRICITVNYRREMIKAAVSDVAAYRHRVEFIDEDEPLGTAGSLGLLPVRPRAPFAVVNADLLTNISLSDMMAVHTADGNMVTMATKREKHVIPYGVVELEGSAVTGLLEKPERVYFLNTGVYVASPEVLDLIPRDRFLDMTDVVSLLLERGSRVGSFPVSEYWLDIGSREHYERAQVDFIRHFSPNGVGASVGGEDD
ncbi:MAG: nucleotidyltransferase family protein [Alphaproteobacteria bacterium]